MDGLWKRLVAGTLLCGTIGCSHFRDKSFKPPKGTSEPPLAMTDKKDGPIKVETLIALGNVRIQAAAQENRSTVEREDLANQGRLVYQQVLAREPKNLDAMLGMARMFAVVRDKDKCAEWYQRAGHAYPNRGDIHVEMGKVLGSHFKDKEAAIACLHTAVKVSPDNRNYRTELGFTLAWAGRYDEGYAWLKCTMDEAKARYNIAGIMEHNGHVAQAKAQLALALQADPNHEPAKQMIAALGGNPREKQTENPIQAARHDEWSTLPSGPSPKIPVDLNVSQRFANPPGAIQLPESMPASGNRQNGVTPPLVPTGGWDN